MELRRNKKVLTLAALVVGVILIWALWPSGPSYQGKPLSTWFYHPAQNDAEVFRAIGQEALPFLVERLEDAPSDRLRSLLGTFSRISREIYRQRKEMWQQRAAYLLGEMGSAARATEPQLQQAAKSGNWAVRGAATVALMKIREEPLEPLIEKLRDTSDSQTWYENAIMVGQFRARAEPAIPLLLDALQHSNNVIQAHALIALGMIGRQPDKCVPAIVPFLVNGNLSDRQKAIGALRSFGTNANPAREAIKAALNDSDPWVRREAKVALEALPP